MSGSVEVVDPQVLAETQAFNAELERKLAAMPSIDTVPPQVTRAARREGKGIFPAPVFLEQAFNLEIDGRAGHRIPLRVVAPDEPPRGVFLHIHGGGFMLGAHDMQDPQLWELATTTGLVAVSVGYRLAPEHPFPAGPDDCEDAARWLIGGGAEELHAPPVLAIGGESAGAHLSALTLQRLRDTLDIAGAFSAAVLTYGGYDMSLTPSQRLWGDRNLVLSLPILRWFRDNFLPGRDPEARRDASVSPLFADLRGMPPALFSVGTQDPLIDDSLFMYARWRAAGNSAQLSVWPEAVHGFTGLPLEMARAAHAKAHAFLRGELALEGTPAGARGGAVGR